MNSSKTAAKKIQSLYEKYRSAILARCRRFLKDEDAAEDATQEIFVRMMSSQKMPQGDIEQARWMQRICSNYCLSLLRDRKSASQLDEVAYPTSGACLESRMVAVDLCQRFWKTVPVDVRAPAELFHCREMDQSAIAESLGVSRRTVVYRMTQFRTFVHAFEATLDSARSAA